MSIVQACFSLGGTVAPFISTAFAQHVEAAYRYFFVAMGVALLTVVMMLWAFEGKTEEQLTALLPKDADVRREKKERKEREKREAEGDELEMADVEPKLTRTPSIVANAAAPLPPADATVYAPDSSGTKMLRIFSTPSVYALIGWAFLYVGVEVSISGWLTSFLIGERGATAAAGYAVTGFWGGMSVGRIVLIPVTKKLGYQFSIYLYAAIALALELTIWFTHSLVGNGVCYAFVGFFLGPIYPNALMVVSEVLDDDLRGGVMGIMGSLGGAGAAAVPFMTGGIADKVSSLRRRNRADSSTGSGQSSPSPWP
jgi:fucose permease